MPNCLSDWTITCLSSIYKIYETKTSNSQNKQQRQQKGLAKLKWNGSREFHADSQSDCSKNMPPANMRNISCLLTKLTNQIVDILYVNDNHSHFLDKD